MQANAQGYEPSFRKTLGYLNENSSTLFDVLRGGYVNPCEYLMFRSSVLTYESVNSWETIGSTHWPKRRTVRYSYKEENKKLTKPIAKKFRKIKMNKNKT